MSDQQEWPPPNPEGGQAAQVWMPGSSGTGQSPRPPLPPAPFAPPTGLQKDGRSAPPATGAAPPPPPVYTPPPNPLAGGQFGAFRPVPQQRRWRVGLVIAAVVLGIGALVLGVGAIALGRVGTGVAGIIILSVIGLGFRVVGFSRARSTMSLVWLLLGAVAAVVFIIFVIVAGVILSVSGQG